MELAMVSILSTVGIAFFIFVFQLLGFEITNDLAIPLNATSTIQDENSKLNNDPWEFTFDLVNAIGSGATASALIFLWKQYRTTQEEFKVTLRPWVGIADISLTNIGSDNEELKINFKNYGRTPAVILCMKILTSNTEITRNDIELSNEFSDLTELTLFPEQPPRPFGIRTGGNTYSFMGLVLEYGYYNNRKGIFGTIQTYDANRNLYRPVYEWFE